MNTARFEFEGSLQVFTGQPEVEKSFHLNPSAKDLVESCGVPHVEVFGLMVNGRENPLSYNVSGGDSLMVIPKEIIDGSNYPDNIRPVDEMPEWFVADVHLGKLARLLRLTGIDTLYNNSASDPEIVKNAVQENRAVLTRDVGLLKHGKLSYGHWLRSTDPDEQLSDVIRYFNLSSKLSPFSRCMSCNGHLKSVEKADVEAELPPRVQKSFEEFMQCDQCGKIYWKGSHYDKLVDKVREIKGTL
ncbi:Mut7-C RNAse domain-containing protein [Rhodohalobacter sp. 8-1]|uniref:Mut7-C RNAse domain-containing protein n=1 Tax=Rhodohalobacter sp. 8-1 TaxID=3131972 RepID=UPI0030ECB594